jgi:hypothetical protein
MTTKIYQAQLPLRKHRIVTPLPLPRPLRPAQLEDPEQMLERFKRKLQSMYTEGFWDCKDCQAPCDREEGENGQPAHCHRCGSHRIKWNPPVDQVLQPEAA